MGARSAALSRYKLDALAASPVEGDDAAAERDEFFEPGAGWGVEIEVVVGLCPVEEGRRLASLCVVGLVPGAEGPEVVRGEDGVLGAGGEAIAVVADQGDDDVTGAVPGVGAAFGEWLGGMPFAPEL